MVKRSITGTGDSTDRADSVYEGQRRKLVRKLEGKEADTTLTVDRTLYSADFKARPGVNTAELDSASFRVESEIGWDDISAKAGRHKDLGQYVATFGKQGFAALSADQEKALEKPTAGYEPAERADAGASLRSLIR